MLVEDNEHKSATVNQRSNALKKVPGVRKELLISTIYDQNQKRYVCIESQMANKGHMHIWLINNHIFDKRDWASMQKRNKLPR